MSEYVNIMTVVMIGIAGVFGGGGSWLIVTGWPRYRSYPSCGACAADVTGSVESGACPACGLSFAKAGVESPRRRSRPILLAIGLMLAAVALGAALLATFGDVLKATGSAL
jgi:hypothetical protein